MPFAKIPIEFRHLVPVAAHFFDDGISLNGQKKAFRYRVVDRSCGRFQRPGVASCIDAFRSPYREFAQFKPRNLSTLVSVANLAGQSSLNAVIRRSPSRPECLASCAAPGPRRCDLRARYRTPNKGNPWLAKSAADPASMPQSNVWTRLSGECLCDAVPLQLQRPSAVTGSSHSPSFTRRWFV